MDEYFYELGAGISVVLVIDPLLHRTYITCVNMFEKRGSVSELVSTNKAKELKDIFERLPRGKARTALSFLISHSRYHVRYDRTWEYIKDLAETKEIYFERRQEKDINKFKGYYTLPLKDLLIIVEEK